MVYLVDDDADDLQLVQEALFENSYKGPVLPIQNGRELMSKLERLDASCHPKVIILDLNMPLLNGFEALRLIKIDPSRKEIPVIILTASSAKADELKCFELGCEFFMNKPTNFSGYAPLASLVKKFTGNLAPSN
jgi:CheY-like chemotaxis protein